MFDGLIYKSIVGGGGFIYKAFTIFIFSQSLHAQTSQQLPDLPFHLYPDSTSSLHQFLKKDKYLLVEIWSITCSPCIKSFPLLNEYQAKYPDNLTILTLLDIDFDKDIEWKEIASKHQKDNVFIQGYSTPEINTEFNRNGYPNYFLFDDTGKLIGLEYKGTDILKIFEAFILK